MLPPQNHIHIHFEMPNGRIYSVQLNIANTKDGRLILYDINKISEIGIDSVLADENAVHADSSAASQNPNSAKGRLTQKSSVVNTHSIQ